LRRILQEAHNENGLYVVNPMHVLVETDQPKHLLIVGPFNALDKDERVMGEQIRTQMIAFGFDVMMFYYLSLV
jgi:hypothetical protein